MTNKTLRGILFVLSIFATGCLTVNEQAGPTLPPASPGGGFIVETYFQPGTNLPPIPTIGRGLTFQWSSDLPGAQGDPTGVFLQTNTQALASYAGGRAPANWTVFWGGYGGPFPEGPVEQEADNCGPSGPSGVPDFATGPISSTIINPITCHFQSGPIIGGGGFGFTPTPAYVSAPPDSGTVYGSGFSTANGMPLLQYFNLDGTYVTQENASYVSPDGTALTVPGGDLSSLPDGTYAGLVNNINSDGSLNYIGAAQAEVAWTFPIYRFYGNGHYWTSSPYGLYGFSYEGQPFFLFNSQLSDTQPFYELYNGGLQKYFYTANYNEMYNCVYYYGWQYVGTLGYIANDQIDGTVPLYRMSAQTGDHLFTTSWDEVQSASWYYGYTYEGVAGYVPMQ